MAAAGTNSIKMMLAIINRRTAFAFYSFSFMSKTLFTNPAYITSSLLTSTRARFTFRFVTCTHSFI
jgi:hypothetical protein